MFLPGMSPNLQPGRRRLRQCDADAGEGSTGKTARNRAFCAARLGRGELAIDRRRMLGVPRPPTSPQRATTLLTSRNGIIDPAPASVRPARKRCHCPGKYPPTRGRASGCPRGVSSSPRPGSWRSRARAALGVCEAEGDAPGAAHTRQRSIRRCSRSRSLSASRWGGVGRQVAGRADTGGAATGAALVKRHDPVGVGIEAATTAGRISRVRPPWSTTAGSVTTGLRVEAVAVADVEEALLVGLDLGKQAHRRLTAALHSVPRPMTVSSRTATRRSRRPAGPWPTGSPGQPTGSSAPHRLWRRPQRARDGWHC